MRKPNRGSFKKGPDPRRHQFSEEERAKGGNASWWRTMIMVRASMGLDLIIPPGHMDPKKVSAIIEEARRAYKKPAGNSNMKRNR